MPLPCLAVLFDFDGVVVESNAIKIDAFLTLYRDHGPAVAGAIAAFYHRHGGLPRDRKFRHFEEVLLGRPCDKGRLLTLCRRFTAMVESAVTRCPEIPGALDFIRRHAATLPLFVASGTPEDELQRIVKARGWTSLFAEARGGPRHKRDVIAGILGRHRLDPARTVMVGDALTDLEAAEANGLRFVGVVRPGADDLFPIGTRIERDLTALDAAIAAVMDQPPAGASRAAAPRPLP